MNNQKNSSEHKQGLGEGLLEYTVSCSIVFEEKIAELYERLSSKLYPPIAEILLHIARESRNHALFFKSLSKILNIGITDCKSNDKISYIEELLGKIRKKKELTLVDVEEILSECVDLEKSVSEEYNIKVLSQLIRANLKPSYDLLNIEGLKTVLEEIGMEESYHSSLIEYVLESVEAMIY